NVACVERAKLGGVCLNWGCIPSKALLSNAELVEKLAKAEFWGIKLSGTVGLNWDTIIGRSREVAGKLNKGIEFLFKKNKITHIGGTAKTTWGGKPGGKCPVGVKE